MKDKRIAELCDAVIMQFVGDKSFFWNDLHGHKKMFNHLVLDSDCDKGTDPEAKYFVIQPIINLLLEDGVLKRMDDGSIDPYLSLTDKGNAIYPHIKNRGYVTKYKKDKKKVVWIYIAGFLTVSTFLILIYNTWVKKPNVIVTPANNIETPANKPNVPQSGTDTQPAKIVSSVGTDTTSKSQNQQKAAHKKKDSLKGKK